MKLVVTSASTYGPFLAVVVTADALVCDGQVAYQLADLGTYEIVDGDTVPVTGASAQAFALDIEDRLDADLDAIAQSWGYKDSSRLATFASSTVAKWQAEAQTFIAGRDAWWTKAASIQSAWTPGSAVPTYESVRAAMPLIARPT